jgi:hypothetical protein
MLLLLLLLLLPLRCVLLRDGVLQEEVPPPLRCMCVVPEQVLAIPWQQWRLHNSGSSTVPT